MNDEFCPTYARAERLLEIFRATLGEALEEGFSSEVLVIKSLLNNIDNLLYVLGEEDTATERYVTKAERIMSYAGTD